MQAGASTVYDGAGAGYNVRGSVNVPLDDHWAVRASAFTRVDPGYIDDPTLGIEDVNRAEVDGGRFGGAVAPFGYAVIEAERALSG